jgi:hypothetical protein
MKNLSSISTSLFNKIRSSFTDLKLGDEQGKVTTNPSQARFFDLTYSIEGVDLGKVNIKLDDDSLTVIYNESMLDEQQGLKSDWFDFLKGMRQFAKRNMLRFDTRDIVKTNLDKRDYQYLAQQTGENKMSESRLFGTSRTSYQDIGNARIVVKHSAPVNYDNPAGRSQRIDSIYIESSNGERFRYPHKHLNGARAMAVHIGNGGTAYDEIGGYISGLSEELGKLRQFKNYASRSGVMSETLDDLTQRVLSRIDAIKTEIHSLQRETAYRDFADKFQPQQSFEVPEDVRNNWVDALTIKSFNEELTDVFPYLYKLVNEQPQELGYEDLVAEEKEVCDDCHKDPCECDDEVKEDSMFAEFEQQMDDITTFDYDVEEGKMSEIDIDLQTLANRGDEEDLIAALEGEMGPDVASVLQNMMDDLKDELASKGMNDVMNDQDKMIEILWDKIVDEYSGNSDPYEGNEFAQKVVALKAKGAEPGTKFKTSDGKEHTLQDAIELAGFRVEDFWPEDASKEKDDNDDPPFTPDENPSDKDEYGNTIKHKARHLARKGMKSVMPKEVVEFITSLYDKETGTFPKGEEGVKIAVEKRFGETAGRFAGFVVEKLSVKNQGQETSEIGELNRIRELSGMPNNDIAEGSDRTADKVADALAQKGIKYNPEKEQEIIGMIGNALKDMGMDEKQIQYLISYDEDFLGDTLDALPREEVMGNQITPELVDIRKLAGI